MFWVINLIRIKGYVKFWIWMYVLVVGIILMFFFFVNVVKSLDICYLNIIWNGNIWFSSEKGLLVIV